MEASPRDTTQDWLLPEDARPPLLGELEERIDEAVTIARASEAAVASIGAAAFDAAEQAKRAAEQARRSAELAEKASTAMAEDRRRRTVAGAMPEDASLRGFTQRADRVVARLRALERRPPVAARRPRH
jgi:hypothetical protein